MLSPVPSIAGLTAAHLGLISPAFSSPMFAPATTTLAGLSPFMSLPQLSAFEGVPIFLVPQGSGASLPLALQRAAEMKVNWATQPGTAQKVDTSKHFHIFVGDLSPEVDNKALKDAFAPFGDVSDAKVIRDLQTLKSKGYGFVSFVKKEEAERAIEQMNGQWLGRRTIRTNWATRKPQGNEMSYDEVYSQTGANNATVYVGGIAPNTTEDELRKAFGKYGGILEVRIFKQQGYAFVRFDSKESATNGICSMNGTEVNGQAVRCSWGRAGQDGMGGGPMAGAGANQFGAYGYGYGGSAGAQHHQQPPQHQPASNAQQQQQQQQYWNYYQQYYNNPQVMQQWQSYWQQAQQGGQ
uniref:RRM domain-containing protein n=1 Tax=Plectus sambesii TaxID=2011161 RepID=A0A914V5C1_9BILA